MRHFQRLAQVTGENLWEQILHWYQNSVIRDLLQHLNDQVFALQFGVYENFSVSTQLDGTLRSIILGLFFGTVLASFFAYYNRNVNGRFIRALLKRGALTPETALTLRDCGVFCSYSVRRELLRGGALSKLTRCVQREALEQAAREEAAEREETPAEISFTPDFLTARFYIPEDLKYRAEFRFEKKGFGKLQLVLSAVLSVLCAYLLCRFLPYLLNFADWLMTVFSPK